MNRKKISIYAKCMYAIKENDIYSRLLGFGLFPEKLPPLFSSEQFMKYCEEHTNNWGGSATSYIFYESIRNTNFPRAMGIPNPFSYHNLCKFIAINWTKIQKHFDNKTKKHKHKVSRIHVRKISKKPYLFEMNYKNQKFDHNPELEIQIGAQYLVKADISNCFPSMYSHALAWALAGKAVAKANRNESLWYNKLDALTRAMKNDETNGFLIGIHASNLLSEIILTSIDEKLYENYKTYFRNIDDYSFYSETYERAEQFLIDLATELREFNLSLNHKKTEIIKLPLGQTEIWVRSINDFIAFCPKGKFDNRTIQAFIDFVIQLMHNNKDNAAIINYAMQCISKKNIDPLGRQYYIKTIFHLALLYPYIFPLLDEYLFVPFDVDIEMVNDIAKRMYKRAIKERNFEAASYSIFFALKYNFKIKDIVYSEIEQSKSCILMVLAWLYTKREHLDELEEYNKLAINLAKNEFDKYWIYIYEVLKVNQLTENWKAIKKEKISFLMPEDKYKAKVSPNYEVLSIDYSAHATTQEMNALIEKIFEEQKQNESIVVKADETEEIKLYNNIILSNLFIGYVSSKNITIPRKLLRLSNGESIEIKSTNKFLKIIDWLRDNHYIGEKLGKPSDEEQPGYISRYWAKEKLYSEFSTLSTSMIERKINNNLVVLKYKNKKICQKYRDTEKSQSYKIRLERINSYYLNHNFKFASVVFGKDEIFYPRLVAVFNRHSWDCGGRLYSKPSKGISFQNMLSDERKTIKINDLPTIELDYSGLHIAMLYAKEHIQPPEKPYDFLLPHLKPLIKHIMMVLINSDSKRVAINEISAKKRALQYDFNLSPRNIELKNAIEKCKYSFEDLVEEIYKKHMPIARYFGSDQGVKLQNIDSIMALDIVDEFVTNNIPILPIHDSFIVHDTQRHKLLTTMDNIFKKYNNNFTCKIK